MHRLLQSRVLAPSFHAVRVTGIASPTLAVGSRPWSHASIGHTAGVTRRSRPRREPASAPAPATARFVRQLEAHFELQSSYGFDPPTIQEDRAEYRVSHAGPAMTIDAFSYGLSDFRNVGIAVIPERRAESFSLTDAMAALDPEHHARAPSLPRTMTEEQLGQWMEHQAAFFHAHAEELLWSPSSVFARVRAAAPLGERFQELIALCRELWALERAHGFAAPRAVHWRHECELTFRKDALRLEVRLEDHENAGVSEPFTVPVLELHDDEAGLSMPLSRIIEALEPEHHAARPVAQAHAMRLELLRPFLEHTATFFEAHPEVLADGRALRELAARPGSAAPA